jgi:HK97 family phage prohead protease
MKNILEYKSVAVSDLTVKDIDEKEGRIIGYFSVFGNIDSDGDMIMPGAFKKSLAEGGIKRFKHLYQHDSWRPLSGTKKGNLVVKEDNVGLHFDSTISQTSWGRDTIKLYVDGVVDEQSVGFQTLRSNDKDKYRELIELKGWEGSTVTWGANEMSLTTSVKSIDDVNLLVKKMDGVMKAIINGKYENEEIFDNLEYFFKQLQQNFIDLFHKAEQKLTLPEIKSSVEPSLLGVLKAFNNSLTLQNDTGRASSLTG